MRAGIRGKFKASSAFPASNCARQCYAPNKKIVAIANNSDGVYLFDDATGKQLAFLYDGWKPPYPKEVIASCVFSPDSSRVILESEGTFSVWDVGSGKKLFDLKRLGNPVMQEYERVSYSHDGTKMIMLDARGGVYVVNSADGAQIRHWLPHAGVALVSACLSPDDRMLLTVPYGDQSVRVWDVETGELRFDLQSSAASVEFSADGGEIVTAPLAIKEINGPMVEVKRHWSSKTGELIAESHEPAPLLPPTNAFTTDYSPDHRYCLNTERHFNGTQVWDMKLGKEVAMLLGPEGYGSWATFAPDAGRILVVAVRGDSFRYWVRQRPDSVLGAAVLPEFWMALVIGGVLSVRLIRSRRRTAVLRN